MDDLPSTVATGAGRPVAVATLAVLAVLAMVAVPPGVASTGPDANATTGTAGLASPDSGTGDRFQHGDAGPEVTIYRAPHDESVPNESSLHAARRAGRLEPSEVVARGDTLLVRITAAGLLDDFRAQPGSNRTERLQSLFAGAGYDLAVRQTEESMTTHEPRKSLGLLEPDALAVVPTATDAVYLVVDTDDLEVAYHGETDGTLDGDGTRTDLAVGNGYEVSVTVDGETATDTVYVAPRDLPRPPMGDAIYGSPGERSPVSLFTTVARGTELGVRFELDGTRNETFVVDDHGRVRPFLDFSNATDGATGTVTVSDSYEGKWDHDPVRIPVRVRTPRATIPVVEASRSEDVTRFSVEANLSHPGFVVVRDGTDDVVGVFGPFDAGRTTSRDPVTEPTSELPDRVRFVAVRDVDQDGEYERDDEPFPNRNATVTLPVGSDEAEPTATDADPTTDGDTESPPDAPGRTETATPSPTAARSDGGDRSARVTGEGSTPTPDSTTGGTGDAVSPVVVLVVLVAIAVVARALRE